MTNLWLLVVTIASVAFAAVMGLVAWRIAREERRRSTARVAALSAEIHAADAMESERYAEVGVRMEAPLRYRAPAAPARQRFDDLPIGDGPGAPRAPSFATADATGTRSVAVVALGVFIVAAIAGVAIFMSGSPSAPQPVPHANTAAQQPAAAQAPLELIALGHERAGNQLTVRGIVRNPALGEAVQQLEAVVFVFDRGGGLAASGRAPVQQPTLAPGAEAPFLVSIADAKDIGRYRVSFRTHDRVVPHLDRRVRGQAAREQ
jgi:flagellar basal body-associated protein FliL